MGNSGRGGRLFEKEGKKKKKRAHDREISGRGFRMGPRRCLALGLGQPLRGQKRTVP